MIELKQTLKERSDVYGEYCVAAEIRALIMDQFETLYFIHNSKKMSTLDFCSLLDIVNKLCRLAATPNHTDSWHDIAGYATQIEKLYLKKGEKKCR